MLIICDVRRPLLFGITFKMSCSEVNQDRAVFVLLSARYVSWLVGARFCTARSVGMSDSTVSAVVLQGVTYWGGGSENTMLRGVGCMDLREGLQENGEHRKMRSFQVIWRVR
jgi:hypothetical protein